LIAAHVLTRCNNREAIKTHNKKAWRWWTELRGQCTHVCILWPGRHHASSSSSSHISSSSSSTSWLLWV
jgi:hypothetical protein